MAAQNKKKCSVDVSPLRITVVDPPPGLSWTLQLGRDELRSPTSVSKLRISFDFEVEAEGLGACVSIYPSRRCSEPARVLLRQLAVAELGSWAAPYCHLKVTK